jgi:hypothetical protein
MMQASLRALALVLLFLSTGCAPSIYHWGQYEDSLYKRQRDASEQGQIEAFKMIEVTVQESEAKNYRVPPGMYADYGYLLFKQGKPDVAITYFRKEADLYKESSFLMESIISRIQRKVP